MKERIMVIQNLLDENRRQLQKVLDLYIDGKFSREVLMKRKKKFEKKIFDLAAELGWLTQTMEEWSNKSENVKRLQELIENIAPLLQEVDTNFIYRRRLVDYVNLQAAVSRQGARLKINITSGIGGAVLTV
jgi:predicted ribosome quality control (RQC) complex YloA/Tae2 family protein